MSILETILNILSTIFGGKKEAQPAEQPQPQQEPEKQPSPISEGDVEEYIPFDDPRVAQTNKGRGLVTWIEKDARNPGHYVVHYAGGGKTYPALEGDPTQFHIKNGINDMVNPQLEYCMTAIKRGKDLSGFTEQEIFDSKVYLGRYVILG